MRWMAYLDIPMFLACAAAVARYAWAWDARHAAGLTLAAAGLVLWVTARRQLGKSFSVRPEARALVTTGLYAKFRNPIYTFAGLAYLGLFIAWGRILPLIFFLLFYFPFQFQRARKESAVLERAFGEDYLRYKARTWM